MAVDIVFIVISLGIILAFCAVFVNAIECIGKACNLHQGIVGSILAAIGTALPETIIPIIAIVFAGGEKAYEVGVGAIIGAPFMLSTLAFFLIGMTVLIGRLTGRRSLKMDVNPTLLSKDLLFFLGIYGIAILTSWIHEWTVVKTVIAVLLCLTYFIYLRQIITHDAEMIEHADRLYLTACFRLPERVPWMIAQLVLALLFIVIGAHLFIEYVQRLSDAVGISPLILSLIITPIATEMPEKFNSMIWICRRKDTLALGNITGAMVFQSCFPVAFGMIFTRWDLEGITLLSAVLALGSALLNLVWLKVFKALNPFVMMIGGILYAVFLIRIITIIRCGS